MADQNSPTARVPNRVSPLAIIIVVILVALAVFAFVQMGGRHQTPSGVNVPTKSPAATQPVMPQQSSEPSQR